MNGAKQYWENRLTDMHGLVEQVWLGFSAYDLSQAGVSLSLQQFAALLLEGICQKSGLSFSKLDDIWVSKQGDHVVFSSIITGSASNLQIVKVRSMGGAWDEGIGFILLQQEMSGSSAHENLVVDPEVEQQHRFLISQCLQCVDLPESMKISIGIKKTQRYL